MEIFEPHTEKRILKGLYRLLIVTGIVAIAFLVGKYLRSILDRNRPYYDQK
jgi:hypothetical protein